MKKEKSVRKAEFQAALFRQLKSLIVPFIILAIILIGVLVISFSQGEAEPEEVVRVNGYEGEETEITLENDKLLFSMNSLTTQFSVTMKETGETWTSNPEGAAEDSAALEIEKNKLQSTVLLTYSTQSNLRFLPFISVYSDRSVHYPCYYPDRCFGHQFFAGRSRTGRGCQSKRI